VSRKSKAVIRAAATAPRPVANEPPVPPAPSPEAPPPPEPVPGVRRGPICPVCGRRMVSQQTKRGDETATRTTYYVCDGEAPNPAYPHWTGQMIPCDGRTKVVEKIDEN